MHHANLEKSPRLQRVLKVLQKYKRPQSTLDLIKKANVCAVNSCISELRRNGYSIKCQNKSGIYYYSLN